MSPVSLLGYFSGCSAYRRPLVKKEGAAFFFSSVGPGETVETERRATHSSAAEIYQSAVPLQK